MGDKGDFFTGEKQLPVRTVGRIAKPVCVPAPTDGLQEVREKNPPVTASPRQPSLGKGAEGTGDADCHGQFANRPRNDIH